MPLSNSASLIKLGWPGGMTSSGSGEAGLLHCSNRKRLQPFALNYTEQKKAERILPDFSHLILRIR